MAMFRFLILIFLLFPKATLAQNCAELFSRDVTKEAIHDLIESVDVKRRLFIQFKRDPEFRIFFNTYTYALNSLYENGFANIVSGKTKAVLSDKDIKEKILHQQIKILSLMDTRALTKEIQKDFIEILYRVYDPEVTKDELEQISHRLNETLKLLAG